MTNNITGQKQVVDECRIARWLDGAFLDLGCLTMEQRKRHTDKAIEVFKSLGYLGMPEQPPAHPNKAEVVERVTRRIDQFQDIVGWQPGESRNKLVAEIRDEALKELEAALSALPPTRVEGGMDRADGLAEDLNQLIRAALTNPADLGGFIQANYPKEYRHYKGRPAVDGKPLELQTRDELLAVVHGLQAENDRLGFEANAGRQAEAEANEEVKELAEAAEAALPFLRGLRDGLKANDPGYDGTLYEGAAIKKIEAAIAKHAAQAKVGAV